MVCVQPLGPGAQVRCEEAFAVLIAAILLSSAQAAPPPTDPLCLMVSRATTAEARVALFSPDGRFARVGDRLTLPPFGIRAALDGVSADRAGNDRLELEFETQTCMREGADRMKVHGLVRHEGLSNEPGAGERYPAAYAATFAETWRREANGWRIIEWEIGAFAPAPPK